MKKQILSFLFVLSAALLISTSAYAQPSTPQGTATAATALDGSTVTYSVTALTGATYHWILSGGSTTNDLPAQPAGALNDNSVSITWDNATPATVYNLDVYVVDANGCYSEMKRTAITINKATIDIDASQTATTCSYLAGQVMKGNATTPANDSFTVNITSNGGITPAAIDYEIYEGAALKDTRSASVTLLTGSFSVSLDGTFVNATAVNKTFTIKLKTANDNMSNSMNVGTTAATITILPIPVISF
jgi:hypothetical protein